MSRHSPGLHDDMPADPEQAVEIDAGGRRRLDIEHVERVDQRHELAARGRGGQQAQQQAGAPRRARADDLRELAAREPAAEPRVQARQRRSARRRIHHEDPAGGSAVVSVRSSWRVRRSDSRSARASGHDFRFMFAFTANYSARGFRRSSRQVVKIRRSRSAGLKPCATFV